MKKNKQCPKCEGSRIGYLETVPDRDGKGGAFDIPRELANKTEGGWLSGSRYAAEVEAYVCTECGYFEEYVKSPGEVEWDKLVKWC